MHTPRILTIWAMSVIVLIGGGCAGGRELREYEQSFQRVSVGMPKDDVLKTIAPYGSRNLIGTTSIEGQVVEEWSFKAGFRYGPDVTHFESVSRYLYFVNGKLVDMSNKPLEYRDRRDLIIEWRSR
jgi:hypothetical protein